MRRFSAEYLQDTRRNLWVEDRTVLGLLELPTQNRVLDVGCGTGALTRLLQEESNASIAGLDSDSELLHLAGNGSWFVGNARTLPFINRAFDLVVCQALLINLETPINAIREFERVSSDLVATIEPDNHAVEINSTVETEADISDWARQQYLTSIETTGGLKERVIGLFEDAGLVDIRTERHDHTVTVEPPYSPRAIESAKRKALGTRIDKLDDVLLNESTWEGFDSFRSAWREMGRTIVAQMQTNEYRRTETVPFQVIRGRTPPT